MPSIKKLPDLLVFRGNSDEIAKQPVIDRQLLFDIEKNIFYLDTKGQRKIYGQDISKIEAAIQDIADKIKDGTIVNQDDVNNMIDDAIEDKQDKITYITDTLYKDQWDKYSDLAADDLHEYYYSNADINPGAKVHMTPILKTSEDYDIICHAQLFPSIEEFFKEDKLYYLIRAKNIPSKDIHVYISVTN